MTTTIDLLDPDKKREAIELINLLETKQKYMSIQKVLLGGIPQQKRLFDDLTNRLDYKVEERKRFYLYYGGNGGGKCHQYSDKILGYDSKWKLAGEIKVGDELMGPDSLPRIVNAIGGGYGKMYKITPESGEPIRVNGDHQLQLIHRRRTRKGERGTNELEYAPEGKLVQISVEDYIKKSTKWKAEAYMWRPNKIDYDKKLLTVDPYFLGVWLGDGNTDSPGITSIDKEIIDYIEGYAKSLGLEIRKNDITYFIRKKFKSRYGFSGYSLLREIGVLGDKHIPIEYLTGSEEQRLELLAGLIDTDGEVNTGDTPRYSITQKSEKLARDILQLSRSLGFRSSIVETVKVCTNATREDYTPGTYYRVSINGDVWRIPVKIERKKRYPHTRRHNKDWRVSKFLVEEDGEDNFYGFSLDGDHLYLDYNFIVQHNTFIGAYVTVLMALGYDTKKYGLPFIGVKKNIWVVTESGSNVTSTIMPYLIGDFSSTRIPEDAILSRKMDNGILKEIKLKNGCTIHIKTYEQGSEKVQGGSPDWIWLDEEPLNEKTWTELVTRTRKSNCEMLVTMTPLNGKRGVWEYFFGENSAKIEDRFGIYWVSSMDNPYTDKTWAMGFTDEQRRLRVDGSFESPTGLVYSSFSRGRNVIGYYDPRKESGMKFYKAIDFGTSHPTALIFLAQDEDDNLYIYDEMKLANTELAEIANQINKKSSGLHFEFFVRDSAAKREGLELEKRFGIFTTPADKHSKGANDMSNRRTGILMINSLFGEGKLFIADSCKQLIKELESHYYKDGNKDGEVIKENDDLLDAMRYCIFMIRKNNTRNSKPLALKKFDTRHNLVPNNPFRTL